MPKSIAPEDESVRFAVGMPCALDLSEWDSWGDMSDYLVDAAVHTLCDGHTHIASVMDIVDDNGKMHGRCGMLGGSNDRYEAVEACVKVLHGQPGVVESIAVAGPQEQALYVNFRLWNGSLLNALSVCHLRAGRRIRASS